MQVFRLQERFPSDDLPPTVVALGFFDGVHAGHRALLEKTREEAGKLGISPAVLTFDDDLALKPDTPRLTDLTQRESLFREAGMAYCFVASFPALKTLSPASFVSDILLCRLHARLAVSGFNFRFGRGATGDAALLASLMQKAGWDAIILPPATLPDGTVISSSAVRDALTRGDVLRAEMLLGRPYSIALPVLHGRALGREIGFPTVNQVFPQGILIPAYGVYATTCRVGEVLYPAVTNIGVRPTVSGEGVTCESHLIGFSGNIYGETLTVTFRAFLRPERKFDSIAALREQIEQDKEKVIFLWQENGHA